MENEVTHAIIAAGTLNDARNIAASILCEHSNCGLCNHCRKVQKGIHPDLDIILPPEDRKQLPIKLVREVVRNAYIAPNEAAFRVFVFANADETLREDAQNALLKLLEEPPERVRIVLQVSEPGALIPTVRSRCRVLRFTLPETTAPDAVSKLANDFFSAVSAGAAELTRFSFVLEKLPRTDFPLFIAEARRLAAKYSREAASGADSAFTVKNLVYMDGVMREAEKYLRFNVGTQHISAKICAELAVTRRKD